MKNLLGTLFFLQIRASPVGMKEYSSNNDSLQTNLFALLEAFYPKKNHYYFPWMYQCWNMCTMLRYSYWEYLKILMLLRENILIACWRRARQEWKWRVWGMVICLWETFLTRTLPTSSITGKLFSTAFSPVQEVTANIKNEDWTAKIKYSTTRWQTVFLRNDLCKKSFSCGAFFYASQK